MTHNEERKVPTQQEEKRPYTRPGIIYTTQLTTRAGSPLNVDGEGDDVDPADLFGE